MVSEVIIAEVIIAVYYCVSCFPFSLNFLFSPFPLTLFSSPYFFSFSLSILVLC